METDHNRPRTWRAIILIAVVAAGAVLLVMLNERHRASKLATAEAPATRAPVGAPFSLVDATGRSVTDRDFHGRHLLLLFASLDDGDTTTAALQVVSAALAQLADPARIAPVLVTTDPQRDTAEQLAAAIAPFTPQWQALTGPSDRIAALGRAYLVPRFTEHSSARGAPPAPMPTAYLVGPDGRFIAHRVIGSDAAAVAAWLQQNQ